MALIDRLKHETSAVNVVTANLELLLVFAGIGSVARIRCSHCVLANNKRRVEAKKEMHRRVSASEPSRRKGKETRRGRPRERMPKTTHPPLRPRTLEWVDP